MWNFNADYKEMLLRTVEHQRQFLRQSTQTQCALLRVCAFYAGSKFCSSLVFMFVFGTRPRCEQLIIWRGERTDLPRVIFVPQSRKCIFENTAPTREVLIPGGYYRVNDGHRCSLRCVWSKNIAILPFEEKREWNKMNLTCSRLLCMFC